MPVNLVVPESIAAVPGVSLGTVAAGLKKNNVKDLVLVSLQAESRAAAVFTRNAYCAAPVTLAREHLQSSSGLTRALLINSGGANAATGTQGLQNARNHCAQVADILGIDSNQVLPFSTGVIGEQLPDDLMAKGIERAAGSLGATPEHWRSAAEGIMTTDTVLKQYSEHVRIDGASLSVGGFAKGSGMIQPNMATMLGYVFTDASVSNETLQSLCSEVAERTFNSITVDGDTSTNDSFVLVATGASGVSLDAAHPAWNQFRDAVIRVATWLAHALVRDGEGASKFITVRVRGGRSESDCKQVALTVGNSPLVKTAFFASDANLGRIIMAVGRSGIDYLDLNDFSLTLGNREQSVAVMVSGQPSDGYTDAIGQQIMQAAELEIDIDIGAGDSSWTCWACDLSHDYVSINADYRS